MNNVPWWAFAAASALAASVIPVIAKLGLRSVNSDLATVVRSLVMAVVLILFASATNVWSSWHTLREGGTKALVCLVSTGIAGALSWIFYFKALQAGEAARVVPLDKLSVPFAVVLAVIVLGERPSVVNWIGIGLAVVGIVLATLPAR
ncbi:MAG: EamA family transporter [Planctomycetota bacterium]|nr:EamA family transporter [Planctomycetota bacterium]